MAMYIVAYLRKVRHVVRSLPSSPPVGALDAKIRRNIRVKRFPDKGPRFDVIVLATQARALSSIIIRSVFRLDLSGHHYRIDQESVLRAEPDLLYAVILQARAGVFIYGFLVWKLEEKVQVIGEAELVFVFDVIFVIP